MKKIFFYTMLLLAVASCKKSPMLMFNDINRVQLADTATKTATFVYDAPGVMYDTEYVKINTIGNLANYDRAVKLEQVIDYSYTYKRDSATGRILDSTRVEDPYHAVPGVHYVPFTDPGLQKLMVIRGGSVLDSVPVVLIRDTSLKTNSYRLHLQLVANDQFGLGEQYLRQMTLLFSDHLERFYSWRVDNSAATAYIYFNKYSTGKHQFMIDVLHTNVDEAWWQAVMAAGAQIQYQTMMRQALADFNNNPDNIASGKAPVRENSSPTSPVITFP